MATACIAQVTFGFEPKAKPVVALFDMPHASSDGGAVLLKALDTQLQLTKRLAACVVDARQPGKVQHRDPRVAPAARVRARAVATPTATTPPGWSTTPSTSCCSTAIRSPGRALASQPTLSRFENAVGWRAVARHGARAGRHRDRARSGGGCKGRATRITIDLDPTDDPTHGQQEFTFFNGHYDTWCYLPIVATVTFNDEPEQFAVAAVLRPGNGPATRGARGDPAAPAGQAARGLSHGHLSRPPGWGLRPPQAVPVSRAAAGRVRRGDGEQRRLEKRARRLMGKARMRSNADRPDRPSVRGDAVRRPEVDAQAPGDHQGRGGPASRPRAQEQSPLRGHQPARRAGGGLPVLLRAGRRGEPAQGTASRAGDGPDQLLAVPGQPVPGPAGAGRVHPVSGTAAPRRPGPPAPMPKSPRCASG